MKWEKRHDQLELQNGRLIVFFENSNQKFQAKDYQSFLAFIQQQQITELNMCQMAFQNHCNDAGAINFQQLMTGIFATPTLTTINFGDKSSSAIHFTQAQLQIICDLAANNPRITDLTLNVCLDNQDTSTMIANMLRANTALVNFCTNTTNDTHGYSILKAATHCPSLQNLHLRFTCAPYSKMDNEGFGDNREFRVTFEGQKQHQHMAALILTPAEAAQRERDRQHALKCRGIFAKLADPLKRDEPDSGDRTQDTRKLKK